MAITHLSIPLQGDILILMKDKYGKNEVVDYSTTSITIVQPLPTVEK